MQGFLTLDKPRGITSRDAVDAASRWFPRKTRIGHAGTLDPLATGVLVVAVGQATRLIEHVQAMPKAYRTRITLGATSDTDDADGTVTTLDVSPVDETVVRAALTAFVGELQQVPPAYSAAHVEGRRAYALARQGKEVTLSPRPVRVDGIDLLSFDWPNLELEIRCGKGTYIRSIARDLGVALGVGGHVAELRRTRIGRFTLQEAVQLDRPTTTLLPMRLALDLPEVVLDETQARRLRMGQRLPLEGEGETQAVDADGGLVAVGEVRAGVFHPAKVFARME